jgi:hypothetical protein
MRAFPSKIEDIPSGNEWVAQLYNIPTTADFKSNLKQVQVVQQGLVASRKMMGYKVFAMIMNWLPYGVAEYMWEWFSNKTTLCYSNLLGPKKGFNFGGAISHDMTAFAPLIGAQSSGIMVFSLAGNLKFSLMSDPANIEDPGEFMQILEEKFKLFLHQDSARIG